MIVPAPGDPDQPYAGMFVHLGKGWKSRPFVDLAAGKSRTLMDADGPGTLQHIWIVMDEAQWRACILRFYWDGESRPSVEAPVTCPPRTEVV